MKVLKQQKNSLNCIVCGVQNNLGLHANFYELEDGSVACVTCFKNHHQSYPNRAHGGMIASLLDETIGRAIWVLEPNVFAVTSTLNIKYRKPVFLNQKIKCVAKIVSNSSRGFKGEASIFDSNGNVLASANAIYVKVDVCKVNFENNNNFLVEGNAPLNNIDF